MDTEDEFPAPTFRDPMQFIKTYSRNDRKEKHSLLFEDIEGIEVAQTEALKPEVSDDKKAKTESLTSRNALTFLLNGTLKNRVCRYCLNITSDLIELDEIFELSDKGIMYKIALKDMVASFHPFKVAEDPDLPNKICNKCTDSTISSYIFSQQCERSERALKNCFEDMYDKLNKLDSLDVQKKRGRQKLNPNYNKLHTENDKVIDYAEPLYHLMQNTCVQTDSLSEFECHKCFEILPDMVSLLNHNKSHPKSMWYSCRFCGQLFPKIFQLKRHFRAGHDSREIVEKPFVCGKCDTTCDTYYKYLEHKEKHTFKSVIEHLVEEKVDRLCAVCLSQGAEMSSLDEIVCLHGGYKEMSGDKSLRSILAATLPENKNKYRELLLPKQASILRFIDKKKENTEFVFAKPDIVTKEDTELDCYLYMFTNPKLNDNFKDIQIQTQSKENNNHDLSDEQMTNVKNDKTAEVQENHMKQRHEMSEEDKHVSKRQKLTAEADIDEKNGAEKNENKDVQKKNISDLKTQELDAKEISEIIQADNIIDNLNTNDNNGQNMTDEIDIEKIDPNRVELFKNEGEIFVNPHYFIDDNDNHPSKIKVDKENWIFNKTETMNAVDVKESNIDIEKPCSVCWVFRHLDKCDNCKKSNNLNQVNTTVTDNSNKDEYKNIKVNNTWQCKVCFINNKEDRVTCQCCDNDCTLKEEKIFNFNKVNKFIETKSNTDSDDPKIQDAFYNDNNCALKEENIFIFNKVHKFIETKSNTDFDDPKIQDTFYNDNITSTQFKEAYDVNNAEYKANEYFQAIAKDDTEPISFMETESQETNFNCPQLTYEPQAMDVEEIEPQTCTSVEPKNEMLSDIAIDSSFKYQFSMGKGDKTVKKKRPFRNVSRAFHK